MTDDLVKRLREFPCSYCDDDTTQAADRIEAQAAEIEKLRDVLAATKDMKWDTLTQGCNVASKAQAMARKALEQST